MHVCWHQREKDRQEHLQSGVLRDEDKQSSTANANDVAIHEFVIHRCKLTSKL